MHLGSFRPSSTSAEKLLVEFCKEFEGLMGLEMLQ